MTLTTLSGLISALGCLSICCEMAFRLVLSMCFLQSFVTALQGVNARQVEEISLIRKESRPEQDKVIRVSIDQHSRFSKDAPDEVALTEEEEGTQDASNPCSMLGCNSHKCAWASGGAITRLTAKKSCSNAFSIGSKAKAQGADAAATAAPLS